jgi:hypothetical protein
VTAWWEAPLGELRHHWGEAYVVEYFCATDVWFAQRRDDGGTLTAESAGELGEKIRADYAARPVPRKDSGWLP